MKILGKKLTLTIMAISLILTSFLFGLPLIAFSTDGWNLPLHIANLSIPYPFTFLQATFIHIGIPFFVQIAMSSLTRFLSAKMKSPYFVLIVLVPVLFIPIFLTPNGTTGAYNLTLLFLPYPKPSPNLANIFPIHLEAWFSIHFP